MLAWEVWIHSMPMSTKPPSAALASLAIRCFTYVFRLGFGDIEAHIHLSRVNQRFPWCGSILQWNS